MIVIWLFQDRVPPLKSLTMIVSECYVFHIYIIMSIQFKFYPSTYESVLLHFWLSVAMIQMEAQTYTTSEGDGSVEVCVELSHLPAGGLDWDIEVTLNVQDGAKSGVFC